MKWGAEHRAVTSPSKMHPLSRQNLERFLEYVFRVRAEQLATRRLSKNASIAPA